jgi:hypothetical protein
MPVWKEEATNLICPCCGYEFDYSGMIDMMCGDKDNFNFCPCCGKRIFFEKRVEE